MQGGHIVELLKIRMRRRASDYKPVMLLSLLPSYLAGATTYSWSYKTKNVHIKEASLMSNTDLRLLHYYFISTLDIRLHCFTVDVFNMQTLIKDDTFLFQ